MEDWLDLNPDPAHVRREREKAQTENLTDQQIVDLVEDAIRSRPQDFPFLTKYYLNAD